AGVEVALREDADGDELAIGRRGVRGERLHEAFGHEELARAVQPAVERLLGDVARLPDRGARRGRAAIEHELQLRDAADVAIRAARRELAVAEHAVGCDGGIRRILDPELAGERGAKRRAPINRREAQELRADLLRDRDRGDGAHTAASRRIRAYREATAP